MNILFVAYHAASSPLMESQGISYMRGLTKKGANYSLLTFESKESVPLSQNRVSNLMNIKWRYLFYHYKYRFLATCFDIISGAIMTGIIIKNDKINIVHARGFIPAIIVFIPAKIFGVRIFFDTRGLLAEKYVGGGLLRKNGITYKLMRFGEEMLVQRSDFITVETYKHAKVMRKTHEGISSKMEVIPCCVDLEKFYHSCKSNKYIRNEIFNLVYLGKAGTWYLLNDMLDFFKIMIEYIPNAIFTFLTQDETENIYAVTNKKGIEKSKVRIIKPENSQIPDLLSNADAGIFFINPYKRYNSSPIKYGEYLSSGLPVILNYGIGDTDVITRKENVGVVVGDFTKADYKTATIKLIDLLKENELLRDRCRKVAEKYFALDAGVEKYWQIYEKLVKA